MSLKRFWTNNSLSIVLFAIFVATLLAMSITGWRYENTELMDHTQPPQSYMEYVGSGDFSEAVFENWESEFLQMWALVVLTIWLRQKGSSESKPIRGTAPQDTSSRYSILSASSLKLKGKAVGHFFYAHSLGFALLFIFIVSFILHAMGGTAAHNDEALQHGSETVSVLGYLGTSQFWFESFQNWQSEFLAVGALILLTIHLRERGSEQSKPVGKSYDEQTSS